MYCALWKIVYALYMLAVRSAQPILYDLHNNVSNVLKVFTHWNFSDECNIWHALVALVQFVCYGSRPQEFQKRMQTCTNVT